MKLALLTLISCCLIALSWQQQYQYRQLAANPYWPEPLNNHRGSQPFYYYYDQAPQSNHPYYRGPYSPSAMSYGSYPNSYQQRHQLAALLSQLNLMKDFSTQETIDNDQSRDLSAKFGSGNSDIMPRVPARYQMKHKQSQQAGSNQENRGFLFPALFAGAQILSTSTSYKFVTSTFTSTTLISCIVSASFYGGSTQTCRRKRSIADIEAEEDQQQISSSAVMSVVPSMIYDELEPNNEQSQARSSNELVSSFEQPEDRSIHANAAMNAAELSNLLSVNRGLLSFTGFSGFTGLFGSAVTSTVTTYSIVTTGSKKTVKIGSSLSCLPSGYSVC